MQTPCHRSVRSLCTGRPATRTLIPLGSVSLPWRRALCLAAGPVLPLALWGAVECQGAARASPQLPLHVPRRLAALVAPRKQRHGQVRRIGRAVFLHVRERGLDDAHRAVRAVRERKDGHGGHPSGSWNWNGWKSFAFPPHRTQSGFRERKCLTASLSPSESRAILESSSGWSMSAASTCSRARRSSGWKPGGDPFCREEQNLLEVERMPGTAVHGLRPPRIADPPLALLGQIGLCLCLARLGSADELQLRDRDPVRVGHPRVIPLGDGHGRLPTLKASSRGRPLGGHVPFDLNSGKLVGDVQDQSFHGGVAEPGDRDGKRARGPAILTGGSIEDVEVHAARLRIGEVAHWLGGRHLQGTRRGDQLAGPSKQTVNNLVPLKSSRKCRTTRRNGIPRGRTRASTATKC
ncbi:hypothetical protein DFJ74DRAFT_297590 [Hyaloraphidium curvatum]|nr:hypothetical protein DFJ74DRAFT_297590 [Hyaloraphidium curvatum]